VTGSFDERRSFREWLSSKLHMWATYLHNDFHTWELTHPDGERITFSCYWQHMGSWSNAFTERCSCEDDV